MPKPRHLAVALALSAAVALSGCTMNPAPVSTAGRADMTVAPPKSYAKSMGRERREKAKRTRTAADRKVVAASEKKDRAADWRVVTDDLAGARFSLPGPARIKSGKGVDGLPYRLYGVLERERGVTAMVTVTRRAADVRGVRAVVDLYARQLTSEYGVRPRYYGDVVEFVPERPAVRATLVFRQGRDVAVVSVHSVAGPTQVITLASIVQGSDTAQVRQRSENLLDLADDGLAIP